MKVEHGQEVNENDMNGLKLEIEEKMSNLLRFRPSVQLVRPDSLDRTSGKVKLFEKTYKR